MKATFVMSIFLIIFSLAGILVYGFVAVDLGLACGEISANPSLLDSSELREFGVEMGNLGVGVGASDYDKFMWAMAFIIVTFAFFALFSLITLMGSVAALRHSKSRKNSYRTFVLMLVSVGVSFFCIRPVSMVLFAVVAGLIHNDCIDESDFVGTKHLGGMRVVEVACALDLLLNAAILLFITKSSFYDAAYWVSFVQMLLMAVTLWLLWHRKIHSREIIMGSVAIYLVLLLIVQVAIGTFDLATYISEAFFPALMLIYFGVSKRVRVVLVEPWRKTGAQDVEKGQEKLWNPKSLTFWRDLLLFFCIFSVIGHWMEYWVCWLIRLGIVPGEYDPNSGIWRDMLNPFFVYGAAMVFIGLLLYPFKEWLQGKIKNVPLTLLASFVANTLFCAVIELAMGLVLNTPPDPVTGKLPLWDYTNMDFNFMGQICLLNTTFFGIMATLMTWLVYPNLERFFLRMPRDVMNVFSVVVFVFFALVVCMYVINIASPIDLTATS